MAVKSTWMDTARNNAKAQDERDKQASIIRQQNIKNQQSAQIASRLDTAPMAKNTKSAQIASRLDNKISSPILNYAIGSWQGAFAADRLNNGSYAATGGIKQEEAAQKAKDLRVNTRSAQLAANLDNSLMGQATRDNQKASFERAMESLYNQMEVAKGANQMQDYTRAQDRYSNISKMLQDLENPTSTAAYAANWENRMRSEIMATDDRVLMPKLERLLELTEAKMREANERGDERRNGLTETEKQYNEIYNSLKNQYGEQVDGWIEYAKRIDNKAKMDERLEQTRQEAKDKKFWSSVKSVPLNMASGAGYMDVVAQKMQRGITGSDAPIDYNSEAQSAAKMVNTIRSTVSEDMGATGQFLYNVGMSIADLIPSIVAGKISPSSAAAIGKATMALLGGSAATNAMQQAVERGASDDQALLVGMLSGALEAAMEKVPLDRLLNPTNTKAVKEIILNTLKQAGVEGMEEGLTTIANTLADALVMGNRSELQTNIRAITAAKLEENPNMSREAAEEAATKEAMLEWLINLGMDTAAGVASGVAFGSITSFADYINYKNSEAATPKLQPETQKQPPVADITPTPQQAQEVPTPASVMPKLQQTETVPIAEFRQTAAEILDEGIFDSPIYGEALEQTGMKRSDVRDALRTVARNNIAASNNPNVQTVLSAIKGVDVQPVQAQLTPEQKVSDAVSRITGEGKDAPVGETVAETTPQTEPTIEFADGTKQTRTEFVEAYLTEFPSASEAEAVAVFRQNEQLNSNGIKIPKVESDTANVGGPQMRTETPEVTQDIRNDKPGAKPAMGDIGDMGAKTSDFLHEVKESQSKTTPRYYEQNNIPEEGRADNHYTERTWAEARHNANVSLEQDYDGEVDDLTRKTVWSDEDSFKAEIILEDIHKKARETGDWSEHQKWSKVFAQHKEELGRAFSALRGLHKNTVETIIADASASLENAVKGTDANAVMREVDEYAVRYEKASETKNVDGLLEIIRDTSVTRKTGTRKGGLSKEIDWALNRVAEYARAELAAGKQAGTLEAGKFYDFLQNFAANGIKAIATDKQKISFGQGYRTIQHNFILSKFLTIMRNLVNNGVLDPLDSFSGNLVIPLDSLLSKYTKTRSVAYDKSWFSEVKRKGSLDGMAMALLEIGLDVNGDGKAGKYEDVGKRTFHMANGGIAKFISAWEKYSGYVMGATDEFTKGGVRDEVQRGIDSLYEQNKIKDDTLRNAGEQAALYRTLQDETIPSKIVTGTRRALNHAQIGGLGLGDVTIKFAQVPANLPARAADFSPVGLVRGLGKMAKVLIDAKNGKLTAAQQASAVKDIGRGITGSGLILASTALALKGIIHVVAPGGEDENKDKAAAEQAQGLKETQLNLSALLRSIKGEDTTRRYGDKMVSFGFLDPINAHLMTGALIAEDIEEAKKAGEKIGLGDVLTDSLQGTIHALLDLPLMDPINDIRYAWQKSDGDNEVEKAWDVVKQGVAGEVTSFIPNALKGIAQGIDPYQRDMYSKDGLVGRTVDQIIGSIPKRREKLPIKQDVYGNDIKNPEQPLNFLNANILPGAITTYTETDLQRVLNDLSEQSGKNSMYLSKDAPKSITVDGEEFKLTKAQQTKFMAERGDIYEAASAALENNETYQNFSIDWKVQAYAEAENYAVQTAKDGLGTKFDPADWVKDLEGASPEEFAEAMVQRVVESMAEKAGENKYLGLETLLENKSIDDQMALSCMSTSCYDAYTANCEKADISVQQFLDAYGTAQASGESNAEKKQAALDYIAGLDISAKQKGALAQAVHEAIGSFIPQDTQLPDQWLIDIGDTNKIVSQMSTDQRQKYNTYVKDSGIKMQMYLDAKEYKDNYDPVSNHGIEAPAAFYEYVTSLGIGSDKAKALYLGFYAESTWEKQVKKHKK